METSIVELPTGQTYTAVVDAGIVQKTEYVSIQKSSQAGESAMDTTQFQNHLNALAAPYLARMKERTNQILADIDQRATIEPRPAQNSRELAKIAKMSLAELTQAAQAGELNLAQFNTELERRRQLPTSEANLQKSYDELTAFYHGQFMTAAEKMRLAQLRQKNAANRVAGTALDRITKSFNQAGLDLSEQQEREDYLNSQFDLLVAALGSEQAAADYLLKSTTPPAQRDASAELTQLAKNGDPLAELWLEMQNPPNNLQKSLVDEDSREARKQRQFDYLDALRK